MADKDKPDVTAPSESIPISTQPNRLPENPLLFRGSGTRKESDVVRVSGEDVFGNEVSPIPSKASGISRAPAPPPSLGNSGGEAPRGTGKSVRESLQGAFDEHRPPLSPATPGDQPSPSAGSHIHSYLSRFSYTDIVVLVVNECLGVPLCIAGGENFAHTDWVGSAIGWGVGIPLCVSGVTFPFWRDPVKSAVAGWAEKRWQLLVPMAVLLAFAYATGPEMYRRATKPIAVTGAIGTMPIGTSSIDEAVKRATKQIEAERDEAVRSAARAAKERDDITKEKDAALSDAARLMSQLRMQPVSPSPILQKPISWFADSQLFVASGGPPNGSQVHGILIMGESTATTAIKEAYLVSGLTGHRQSLKANVHSVGAYFPVDKVDIPAGAPVQLDLIFDPPVPLKDFMDQWAKFRFTVVYSDGTSYEREYDEAYVRQKMQQVVPEAFGPRMTPREDK